MKLKSLNQFGDTIIEVMITTTVLALVLTVSFVSANRSLSSGTQAANRRQALQYAEEQVELIRVAANAPTADQAGSNYSDYTQSSQPFCIRPTGSNAGRLVLAGRNSVCASIPSTTFRAGIVYSAQTFTVSVKWEHPGDGGGFASANNDLLDQVTLYYRAR